MTWDMLKPGDRIRITSEGPLNGKCGTVVELGKDRETFVAKRDDGQYAFLSPASVERIPSARWWTTSSWKAIVYRALSFPMRLWSLLYSDAAYRCATCKVIVSYRMTQRHRGRCVACGEVGSYARLDDILFTLRRQIDSKDATIRNMQQKLQQYKSPPSSRRFRIFSSVPSNKGKKL